MEIGELLNATQKEIRKLVFREETMYKQSNKRPKNPGKLAVFFQMFYSEKNISVLLNEDIFQEIIQFF